MWALPFPAKAWCSVYWRVAHTQRRRGGTVIDSVYGKFIACQLMLRCRCLCMQIVIAMMCKSCAALTYFCTFFRSILTYSVAADRRGNARLPESLRWLLSSSTILFTGYLSDDFANCNLVYLRFFCCLQLDLAFGAYEMKFNLFFSLLYFSLHFSDKSGGGAW